MATKNDKTDSGNFATAKALNLPVSTKQCIEICRSLRYKNTGYAKGFLTEVAALKKAVPFRRFNMDMGHKPGMAAGRFPQKAAKEFLKLVNSAEANAQVKGLNTSNLKITKIMANVAPIPLTGGRQRRGTKRTHLEIEVKEGKVAKTEKKVAEKKKVTKEKSEVKTSQSEVQKEVIVEKMVEEKVEEVKEEVVPVDEVVEEEKMEEPKTEEKKEEEPKKEPIVKKEKFVKEPVKEVLSKEAKEPTVKVTKPILIKKELSSEELLQKAQEKAAQINQREKEQKSTEEVSKLYRELQQKGSLRNQGEKQ